MRIFFLILFFSSFFQATNENFDDLFIADGKGWEMIGARVVNHSTSLNAYNHLQENKEKLNQFLLDIKFKNYEEIIDILSSHDALNPYSFLRECDSPECPLTRTATPGYREQFLQSIQDNFFAVLKEISNQEDGIDISFLGSGGLLFEAKLIELMQDNNIKIKSINLIDTKYKNIKTTFDWSSIIENIISKNEQSPSLTIIDTNLIYLSSTIKIIQLIQFRNYITRKEQSPHVVIFDSEQAFTNSNKTSHLLVSVDLLTPEILTDPKKSTELMQSLIKMLTCNFLIAILWNDGGDINEIIKNTQNNIAIKKYN